MKILTKKLSLFILAFLPSNLKIWILNKYGHDIHPKCRLGISYYDIKHIKMKKGAAINHFNYFKNLQTLEMGEKARIGGRFNWFTASPLHINNNAFSHGILSIGDGSNITSNHFFDIQRSITIGNNTLIAGFRSSFWTHGYRDASNKDYRINIGNHCYIGSQVIFTPGAGIGNMTFVGAGSVISKNWTSEEKCLLGGNPAVIKKRYSGKENFFSKSHTGFSPK